MTRHSAPWSVKITRKYYDSLLSSDLIFIKNFRKIYATRSRRSLVPDETDGTSGLSRSEKTKNYAFAPLILVNSWRLWNTPTQRNTRDYKRQYTVKVTCMKEAMHRRRSTRYTLVATNWPKYAHCRRIRAITKERVVNMCNCVVTRFLINAFSTFYTVICRANTVFYLFLMLQGKYRAFSKFPFIKNFFLFLRDFLNKDI